MKGIYNVCHFSSSGGTVTLFIHVMVILFCVNTCNTINNVCDVLTDIKAIIDSGNL